MEEKENVYLPETQTGIDAEAQSSAESEGAVKEISTVLGKFKDVDALANAYHSLQAEFTRRSQRLKELEREIGKMVADKGETDVDGRDSVVEKLRKNASSAREENQKFSSFVAEIERSHTDGELPEQPPENNQANEQSYEDEAVALTSVVAKNSSVAGGREQVALTEEELYDKANCNEAVRLKIIGEYLSSLKKSGAPLMTGGAGTLAAPPIKAKSVQEAGNMALCFFKRGAQA